MFEKLFLEGRPPLNVGVTSGGDFFGGSQVALADVLGRQELHGHGASLREFRSYEGTYIDLGHRFQYGFNVFDNTQFFYASPYGCSRASSAKGAFATQRYTGGLLIGQYPLDKFNRLEINAGVDPRARAVRERGRRAVTPRRRPRRGQQFFLNNGNIAPLTLALVGETTRFREFGPLTGHTYRVSASVAPGVNGFLSRQTVEVDARKYLRLGGSASWPRACAASGPPAMPPTSSISAATWSCGAIRYLSFVGNQGFFANLELRIPIIDLMKTPIGILGPVRGTLYGGIGRAQIRGDNYALRHVRARRLLRARPRVRRARLRLPPGERPRLLRHRASSSSSWATRCTSTGPS